MSVIKNKRLAEDIRSELAFMLRELKDPRVSQMLSITNIELSNDLSHCKVYVSAIEGFDRTKESVEGLKSASGFIRHEIAARVKMRKAPEFTFIADDSIEYSANINKILHNLD